MKKKKAIFPILPLLLAFAVLPCMAPGQNINKVNKRGPMGLQVNTLTGNLFLPRTDLSITARAMNLTAAFFYNSFTFGENNGYGNGWSFGYNIRYRNDTGSAKTIIWGDGREDLYRSTGGGNFQSPAGFFTTLREYAPGKLSLRELTGATFYFDNPQHKRITKIEEPNGNYLSFQYTDTLLTAISTAAGQTLLLSYSNGRLASLKDAVAQPVRQFEYSYDAAGNLVKVKDPLNGTLEYSYLVNGPLKTVQDKNKNVVDIVYYNNFMVSEMVGCNKRISFSYDSATLTTFVTDHLAEGGNQVTKYEYNRQSGNNWLSAISGNCCGFEKKFEFDAQGNKVKEIDARGNATTFTYDEKGNLLTITDALGQVMKYAYSTDYNQVTAFTDKNGAVTNFTYDNKGNLTKLTEPGNHVFTAAYNAAGDVVSSTDPKGNVFTYTYDAYGAPKEVTGPNGFKMSYVYDARGKLLSYTTANGSKKQIAYDILYRVKKITDPLNNAIQVSYDAAGNATAVTNENGETNQYGYDASNRMVRFTDVMGQKMFTAYDEAGNVKSVTDAKGNTFTLRYDTRNRLAAMRDAAGNEYNLSYDPNGNIKTMSLPTGRILTYTYDALDRVTAISDLNGNMASYEYDKNGNIISYTNGTGASRKATFDNLDRLVKLTDALGQSVSFTYDQNGKVASVTDPNGNTSTYTYDELNRVKTATDANGGVVTLTYDATGNVTSLKDQNNNTTAYQYDAMNRVKTVTFPDGRYMEMTYDKEGNLASRRLTDGTVMTFQYDALNRLTKKTLPDGHVYSFTYDERGLIKSATNNAGTISLTYDALGRLLSEAFDGNTVRYSYDVAGRTETILYPDSTVVTKIFDTRNRLVSVAKNNTVLITYDYNNANQLVRKSMANGVVTNLQYDFANRLTHLSTADGTVQNTVYTYDNKGNKLSINRLNNPALSEQFAYDKINRLTGYKRGPIGGTPLVQNTYTYDAVGNRTAATLNGVNLVYANNNLNQLTGISGGASISFTYDNNGNRTYDGIAYKNYDAEGRLLKDSLSPSVVYTYRYDAVGRRVQKSASGGVLKYTYSGLMPIEEKNAANSLLNRTVFARFLSPVLNEKEGSGYYYHPNEMGSVEALTNSAGSLTERYQYDAYGKPSIYDAAGNLLGGSLTGNRFGFTGQEWDSATHTYRFHYRNYSPETGAFLQRDPLGYADGTSLYRYVQNDPANRGDLLGLMGFVDLMTIFFGGQNPSDISDYDRRFQDAETLNVELWFHGDPCKHDQYKHRYITKQMLEELKARQRREYGRDKISNSLVAGWGADSRFYTDWMQNFGDNQFIFNGEAMNSWEVNYYFTQYANASRGQWVGSEAMMFGTTFAWNEGKAVLNGQPFTRTQELVPKEVLTLEAHDDFVNNRTGGHNIDEELYDFDHKYEYKENEFGEWWPVQNPYTHEWGYEFFAKKWIKRSRFKDFLEYIKKNCPPDGPSGGSQRRNPNYPPGFVGPVEIISAQDPNEIIGPDGAGSNKYVSVKDRMPYTITYENDRSASAPAKFVRITLPVPENTDPGSFQLGSFGFNSLTFAIPAGTSSYYQRLDARDSLGLYIDLTAGYDPVKNQAFWELQSIDPVTLLPPADPLKGFLLLQDTSNASAGHGFVNFSLKPIPTAHTGDTVSAIAYIVFDTNDTIPTNRAKNTIDALPPASTLSAAAQFFTPNSFILSWKGTDDPGGSGVASYSVYVSVNGAPYTLYRSGLTDKSLLFSGLKDSSYCFFVTAKDSVNNEEALKNRCDLSVLVAGMPLPLTWLDFTGTRRGNDALLRWITANEANTQSFAVERSLDGMNFTTLSIIGAKGGTAINLYDFTDKDIVALGKNLLYYRLKQVDHNGRFTYSKMVVVRIDQNVAEPLVMAFPNPFSRNLTVQVNPASGQDKTTLLELYSLQGTLLYRKEIGQQGNVMLTLTDLPVLASGVYVLRTTVNGIAYTTKVVKN